jgi:tRNA U55 pseudouridine synthase TruB
MKELSVDKKTSKFVIPMRQALRGIPEIQARRALARKIGHGQPVTSVELGPLDDGTAQWIKVTDTERHLIAVLDSKEKNGVLPYKCVFPKEKA